MARVRAGTPLHVFLNGRLVGGLRRERSGAIEFQYDRTWLQWEHTLPVSLSLPLREDRYTGDRVLAVFDGLLPDNREVRRQMAARLEAEGDDTYSLLATAGRDCIGALQFLPQGMEPGPAGQIEGTRASDARIAGLLADLDRTPLGVSAADEHFRISLAGAQEKTALLYRRKRWYFPHGSTATTHILKPQIGVLRNGLDLSRSVENEHLCMLFTAAVGLPTATTAIADFGDQRVLVVERFDRRWTRDGRLLRLPQEDCCQALSVNPVRKYQSDGGPGIRQILQLLKTSDDPDADRRLFIKAQIAFWLLGAPDGHAKNFSIALHPGGGFRLAPLYDVMSLQPNYDARQIKRGRMKLAMSVGDKRHYVIDTVQPRHFIQSAAQAGMPASVVETLMRELSERAAAAAETAGKRLPRDFPQHIAKSIFRGVAARAQIIRSSLGGIIT